MTCGDGALGGSWHPHAPVPLSHQHPASQNLMGVPQPARVPPSAGMGAPLCRQGPACPTLPGCPDNHPAPDNTPCPSLRHQHPNKNPPPPWAPMGTPALPAGAAPPCTNSHGDEAGNGGAEAVEDEAHGEGHEVVHEGADGEDQGELLILPAAVCGATVSEGVGTQARGRGDTMGAGMAGVQG